MTLTLNHLRRSRNLILISTPHLTLLRSLRIKSNLDIQFCFCFVCFVCFVCFWLRRGTTCATPRHQPDRPDPCSQLGIARYRDPERCGGLDSPISPALEREFQSLTLLTKSTSLFSSSALDYSIPSTLELAFPALEAATVAAAARVASGVGVRNVETAFANIANTALRSFLCRGRGPWKG